MCNNIKLIFESNNTNYDKQGNHTYLGGGGGLNPQMFTLHDRSLSRPLQGNF